MRALAGGFRLDGINRLTLINPQLPAIIGNRLLVVAAFCITATAIAPPARSQAASISVSGDPAAALTVSVALAGSTPMPVSDATTTYAVQTTTPGNRITAVLGAPLPSGVTLEIELAAPPGAVNAGRVALSLVPQTVVWGIPAGQFSGLSINYYFTATTTAGVVPRDARSVVITVTP